MEIFNVEEIEFLANTGKYSDNRNLTEKQAEENQQIRNLEATG